MPSESTPTMSPSGGTAATGADAGKKETHPDIHPRYLLHEPAGGRHGRHHRQCRVACHSTRSPCHRFGTAMDSGRVHAGSRQPAHACRLRVRSCRAAARLSGWSFCFHVRFAALQPVARHRAARRLPRPAGPWRVHAQPGSLIHHCQCFSRIEGTGARGRRVGRGGRRFACPGSPYRRRVDGIRGLAPRFFAGSTCLSVLRRWR